MFAGTPRSNWGGPRGGDPRSRHNAERARRALAGPVQIGSDDGDIRRLQTPGALVGLVGDLVALVQGAQPAGVDRREMGEDAAGPSSGLMKPKPWSGSDRLSVSADVRVGVSSHSSRWLASTQSSAQSRLRSSSRQIRHGIGRAKKQLLDFSVSFSPPSRPALRTKSSVLAKRWGERDWA